MIVKVIGIENQDFTFPDGKQYTGKKLHVAVVDQHKDGLIGCPVEVIKIPSSNEFYSVPIDVDKHYIVFFDQKGKVAYFKAQS